jgi:hypothetical protein
MFDKLPRYTVPKAFLISEDFQDESLNISSYF